MNTLLIALIQTDNYIDYLPVQDMADETQDRVIMCLMQLHERLNSSHAMSDYSLGNPYRSNRAPSRQENVPVITSSRAPSRQEDVQAQRAVPAPRAPSRQERAMQHPGQAIIPQERTLPRQRSKQDFHRPSYPSPAPAWPQAHIAAESPVADYEEFALKTVPMRITRQPTLPILPPGEVADHRIYSTSPIAERGPLPPTPRTIGYSTRFTSPTYDRRRPKTAGAATGSTWPLSPKSYHPPLEQQDEDDEDAEDGGDSGDAWDDPWFQNLTGSTPELLVPEPLRASSSRNVPMPAGNCSHRMMPKPSRPPRAYDLPVPPSRHSPPSIDALALQNATGWSSRTMSTTSKTPSEAPSVFSHASGSTGISRHTSLSSSSEHSGYSVRKTSYQGLPPLSSSAKHNGSFSVPPPISETAVLPCPPMPTPYSPIHPRLPSGARSQSSYTDMRRAATATSTPLTPTFPPTYISSSNTVPASPAHEPNPTSRKPSQASTRSLSTTPSLNPTVTPARATAVRTVSATITDASSSKLYLPSEANKYAGLCKGAWRAQIGDSKRAYAQVTRPTGITGKLQVHQCRSCAFDGRVQTNAITGRKAIDTRVATVPGSGVSYRWEFLFKSHLPTKLRPDPAQQQHPGARVADAEYGCMFCCALGRGTPVFAGLGAFVAHLSEHRPRMAGDEHALGTALGGYPAPDGPVLDRMDAVVGRVPHAEEKFDVALALVLPNAI